jgi:hypothetical protein
MAKMKFAELTLQFDHIGKFVHAYNVSFAHVCILGEMSDLTLNLGLFFVIWLRINNQVQVRVSLCRLDLK